MSEYISLQQLVAQIRKELLSPHKDRGYPIFRVDQVELELGISISTSLSGELSISVLQTIGGKAQKINSEESMHKIKLILKPIVSAEDLLSEVHQHNDRMTSGIDELSRIAFLKSEDE